MTKEDAIDIIKSECYVFNPLNFDRSTTVNTALDMAVKALSAEPCEDAIDRAEAMTEIMMFAGNVKPDEEGVYLKVSDAVQLLRELPSVTPKPKMGRWSRKTKVDAYDLAGIKTWGIKCQCDKCDFTTIVVEGFGYYKYCPNCGCRMVEVDGEE